MLHNFQSLKSQDMFRHTFYADTCSIIGSNALSQLLTSYYGARGWVGFLAGIATFAGIKTAFVLIASSEDSNAQNPAAAA